MVALMVVVAHKRRDMRFKITGQEVVFLQNAVLECQMPAFDLALSLQMIGRTACMLHTLVFQILGQIT